MKEIGVNDIFVVSSWGTRSYESVNDTKQYSCQDSKKTKIIFERVGFALARRQELPTVHGPRRRKKGT